MTDTPPPPPPHGASTSGAALSESEDRQWASFAHLGGIIGLLPALIIYLVFKDRGSFTRQESKEALNFQITVVLALIASQIVGYILAAITLGILFFLPSLLWFAIWIGAIIFSVLGFMKAKDGVAYRYPIAIRLVK
ncbi:MAG TPA: DUF4870 domain-containing protein [Microcella sp.]|nr:DUF4870 domain-containing protein [Microcella sp.]